MQLCKNSPVILRFNLEQIAINVIFHYLLSLCTTFSPQKSLGAKSLWKGHFGPKTPHMLKYQFLDLLICKNEWYHWKELEKLVKRMVWFSMSRWKLCEIFQVESTFILLSQHFSQFLWIFNPLYFEKFSSKHTKPHHFLYQFSELFPVVPFIFTFEQI